MGKLNQSCDPLRRLGLGDLVKEPVCDLGDFGFRRQPFEKTGEFPGGASAEEHAVD